MQRTIVVVIFTLLAAVAALGCEAEQCTQMRACCAAVSEEAWVGEACGSMTEQIRNPDSCRSIVEAITVASESRNQPVPPACQ